MANDQGLDQSGDRLLSRASIRVLRRFTAPERHLAFWLVMWILVGPPSSRC